MPIKESLFGERTSGEFVKAFDLSCGASGLRAQILNLGAIINQLWVPDRSGVYDDVVLGCDTVEDHLNSPYFGAAIGRYANRIRKGSFCLEGKEYQLCCNDNGNHLHGGREGFNRKLFQVEEYDPQGSKLVLRYHSRDGEENYPGNLNLVLSYELGEDYIEIEYQAETDKATILNLSNHSYFNLAGHNSGAVDQHFVRIAAELYSEADEALLLSGRDLSVSGTAYDFRKLTQIVKGMQNGRGMAQMQSHAANGAYDTNYPLEKGECFGFVAELLEEKSGRCMFVESDQPCVQFYTGNSLKDVKGKGGALYGLRAGLCLETQHYPDSPNFPQWPSTVLLPGQVFTSKTVYRFSVMI